MATIQQEGQDPFAEPDQQETATPDAPPAETKPTDTPASPDAGNSQDDSNVPFHKHPRWIEREQELQELRAFREEAASKLAEIDTLKQRTVESNPSIPQWFSSLYGENPEAWAVWQAKEHSDRESIKQEVIAEIERKEREQKETVAKWDKWVNDQVQSLLDEGKQFERNEFLKFMNDYRPGDDKGSLDFKKGYDLFEKLSSAHPKSSHARKALADSTVSGNQAEAKPEEYQTTKSLRGKSWFNL